MIKGVDHVLTGKETHLFTGERTLRAPLLKGGEKRPAAGGGRQGKRPEGKRVPYQGALEDSEIRIKREGPKQFLIAERGPRLPEVHGELRP